MKEKKSEVHEETPAEKIAFRYLKALSKYSINIRSRHGLSASDLSRSLGVSRGYISMLEDMKPELTGLRVSTLAAFAIHEGITVARLCAILEGGGQASAASTASVPLKPFQRQLLEACENVREDIATFFFSALKKFKTNKLVPEPNTWALELAAMLLMLPPAEALMIEQDIKDRYLRHVPRVPEEAHHEILERFREILQARLKNFSDV